MKHHGQDAGRRAALVVPRLLALLMLGAPQAVQAHAVLLEAQPAAGSSVAGPDVAFRLRFNSRVDGARSRLSLVLPDKTVRDLALEKQDAPTALVAKATGLRAGAYRVRWQVLAADGHITRGEYGFDVS
jgi:methionine-rich copper-binding protein CopC